MLSDEVLMVVIKELGSYGFYLYLFVMYALPKLSPAWTKILNRRVDTENRLFKILEEKNETDKELAIAISGLTATISSIDRRVEKVEDILKDKKTP
jgi:hypothetical protein